MQHPTKARRRDSLDSMDEGGVPVGVMPDKRTIYLFGPVTSEVAAAVVPLLHDLDSEPGEITIWLQTNGGDVGAGCAIFDALVGCRNPVTTIGTGSVFSMGAVLFQAGTRRLVTPNTLYMLHNGTVEMPPGDPEQLATAAQEAAEIRKRLTKQIARRCRLSVRAVERIFNAESWFNSEGLVAKGLADGILKRVGDLRPIRVAPKKPRVRR